MRGLLVIVALTLAGAAVWIGRGLWPTPPATPEAVIVPAAPASAAIAARHQEAVESQAQSYVTKLTAPDSEPVKVERADHFVTGEQMLSLVPDAAVERTTLKALQADPGLGPDTPITVVREVEQVERVTPEKLIARSGGRLDTRVTVLLDNEAKDTTVREVLERARQSPGTPIDIVTVTEYYEQTTPRELAERSEDVPDAAIKIIRRHRGAEAASVAELMRREQVSPDALFYVRTVRPDDDQGIWGIVQHGIISNFARGMAIRRGREIDTYRVEIPTDADEREGDRSSSFLGKLIHDKTKASFVYNFNHNRMGRNPNRIVPGQEIVIIDFKPEELIRIYRHFVENRG